MDTKDFLDLVLPHAGQRCVGALRDGQFSNYFGSSNEWSAKAIERIDARGVDAYFACASFKTNGSRKATNVEAVRSFWLDIDTQEGKPKEKYATRKAALQNVLAFCEELNLTKPYVVSSGYGIHIYWPCDEDMAPAAWNRTATLLKKATKVWGLAADPSRTSDEASVLRPPGARNFKRGSSKDVRLVMSGAITSHAMFHMRMEEFLGEDELPEGGAETENVNSDLMTKTEYAPSDAEKVAHHCAVVREVKDTQGDVDQPTWYRVLGVLAFTEQGEEICHEWSKGYPGYSPRETSAKYAQAKQYAPTTCEKLEECRPAACAACPHFGKVKSPITLGTANGAPQPIPVSMLPDANDPLVRGSTIPVDLPAGYGWGACGFENSEQGLYRESRESVVDPDSGTETWVSVKIKLSDVLFFPINRVRAMDGTYVMNIYMVDGHGRTSAFLLDNGAVSEGGRALFSELGRREIGVHSKAKQEVVAYLTTWIGKLREEYAATISVEQFGWVDQSFVLADALYTASGQSKAVLNKGAASKSKHLGEKGSLQAWVDAVDQAYNRPGSEPFQFSVLCSFAAPLMHMLLPNGGVFVHSHGHTGHGKSTSQFVGLSAWGDYTKLLLREGPMSTVNAMYNHFGVMKNLPIVVDEMTNCSNQFASELVYNTSAGSGKKRMNADGSERETYDWSTIVCGSSNNMIAEKLSLHRANAEAELARIWEFKIDHTSSIPTHVANKLFPQFQDNYGHAGRVYIEYLTANYDDVKRYLQLVREKFDLKAGIKQSERYWSALHACVLTALNICRKLGLLQFDSSGLVAWIISELANNRTSIVDSVLNPLEQFGDMLSDIFNGMLVTIGEGNIAHGSEATILKHPKTSVVTGRSILPTANTAEKLFVSAGAAKEWCNARKVSFKEVFDALVAAGWADPQIKRMSLGKGTKEYSGLGGPVKVIELTPSAVRAAMGDNAVAQKITGVIQGGLQSDATGTDN